MDLGETGLGLWSGFSWLSMGPVVGCSTYGDEPSGSGATELVNYTKEVRYYKWLHQIFYLYNVNLKHKATTADSNVIRRLSL
jgi:hypothetical protein